MAAAHDSGGGSKGGGVVLFGIILFLLFALISVWPSIWYGVKQSIKYPADAGDIIAWSTQDALLRLMGNIEAFGGILILIGILIGIVYMLRKKFG